MGYALTISIAAIVLFPVAWPIWWFLASGFDRGSHQHGGRARRQVS
jgi:hypothetical protein